MGTEKIVFYEKPGCGTCKKARAWLERRGVQFQAVDIVNNPPPKTLLEKIVNAKNVKASLNTRATLYREREMAKDLPSKQMAIRYMLEDPNLIRRPLIVRGRQWVMGFDPKALAQLLK